MRQVKMSNLKKYQKMENKHSCSKGGRDEKWQICVLVVFAELLILNFDSITWYWQKLRLSRVHFGEVLGEGKGDEVMLQNIQLSDQNSQLTFTRSLWISKTSGCLSVSSYISIIDIFMGISSFAVLLCALSHRLMKLSRIRATKILRIMTEDDSHQSTK